MLGWWPYLLLMLCPLMHLFRGHGPHRSHPDHRQHDASAGPTARTVGARLGLDEVHAEVKPADKLALVSQLQAQGHLSAALAMSLSSASVIANALRLRQGS